MCSRKEVYLSAIQSYLQFSPYFTHTKKCKKFYITMWNTYNTRTNVILKKKMHTLKFVSTVKLYDEASEVCCEMSGTHKKINHQGHEIDCCGGKLCSSISFWFFTVHLFFSVKFTNNNQCNIQYHSVTYRIVIFNKNTYCNINQLFIFYKFISQFPSKR